MIVIGVNNLGDESYWKRVYLRLVIPMSPESTSFLQDQDKYRFYRSICAKKNRGKKHQMNTQNQKIKDLMERQKIDETKRVMTYGTNVALKANLILD